MKYSSIITAALIALPGLAAAQGQDEIKHFSVGVASYATVISYTDRNNDESDTYSGPAIFAAGAINDNFAGRLVYASQEETDDSSYSIEAYEAAVLAGTGLATKGFRAYGSVGMYDETHDYDTRTGTASTSVSGFNYGGGIGYSWSRVTLEFWVNAREVSDYEDKVESSGYEDVVAAAGGLAVSARF